MQCGKWASNVERDEMRTAWGKGCKKNKQHAMTETMGLLLIGVKDSLSEEVTFKLDLNIRKKLASWEEWRDSKCKH